MATSIPIQIRDVLIAAVGNISVANSYRTNNVTTDHRLIKADMLPVQQRLAHFCRWTGRTSEPQGNISIANASYLALVKMENATEDSFALFLEDIEAAIANMALTQVDGTYYALLQAYVSEIRLVDVEEPSDDRIQEAEMTIVAMYKYAPEMIAGV